MATELISEFVDLTGLNSQKDAVLKALNEMQSGMEKLGGAKISFEFAGNLKQAASASQQYVEGLNQVNNAQTKLNDTATKTLSIQEKQAKADLQDIKNKKELTKYQDALRKEQEKLNKERVKEEEHLGKLNNAYEQLKKQYQIASNTAKNLAAAKGLDNAETKEALAISAKYYDSLIKIEKAVGQAQRQVGQYERAGFALNQVLREAPAFANSFATGISAISNNLPMLTDEFKKLRESTGSSFQAFKILAGGLLSFNAILPIAFMLIQTYGKEIKTFFDELFSGKEKIDQLKESQLALNEAYKSTEFKQAIQSIDEMKNVIQLAKDGVIDKKRALDEYNKGLGQTIGKAGDLNEAEQLLIKNGPAYINMMLAKAAATISLEKAAQKAVEAAELSRKKQEEFAKSSDQSGGISSFGSITGGGIFTLDELQRQKEEAEKVAKKRKEEAVRQKNEERDTLRSIADEFNKEVEKIAKDNKFNLTTLFLGGGDDDNEGNGGNEAKKRFEDQRKAAYELKKKAIEDEIGLQQFIADNEDTSFTMRSLAAQKATDARKQLARLETAFLLNEITERAKEEKTTTEAYANEILLIRQEGMDKEIAAETKHTASVLIIRKNIVEQARKDGEDLVKITEQQNLKALNSQLADADKLFQSRVRDAEQAADREHAANLELYKRGKISKEQYEAEKLAIENRFRRAALLAEIDHYEALLKIAGLPADKEREALEKLAALRRKLNKEDIKDSEDATNEKIKQQEQLKAAYVKLANELKGLAFDVLAGSIEKEKNATQEQIDKLEDKKKKDIDVTTQTISNAQERAAAIAVIEAKANAEKERLERKKRQLDEQKARFERARSIVEIIQNTGVAVSGFLAEQNYPMAILSGIIGAAQIARVVAQPIPKYKDGKKKSDNYEGFAIVGDGGKQEAIIRESGQVEITPAKDTLTWVGEKDIVLPDASKLAMQFAMNKTNSIVDSYNATKIPDSTAAIHAMNRNMTKELRGVAMAVKESKPTIITKGINRDLWMKYGSNYTNYI